MTKQLLAAVLGLLWLAPGLAGAAPDGGVYGTGPEKFSLATGSPGELGLVQALAAGFDKAMKGRITLQWVKAGSGESLKLLKDKKVDLIMVHAPAAEKQAVQEGWARDRTLLGSNEFFIVGPAADPAKIAAATSAVDAYRRIAAAHAKFFSRGDNSGTHKKELHLWKEAGIKPAGRLVHCDQGFHDRHPETGRPGTGLLHGGQQHLDGGKKAGAQSQGPV